MLAEGWGHEKTERQLPYLFLGPFVFGYFLCSVCVLMSQLLEAVQFHIPAAFESAVALLTW